uniref:Zn(2)-C6 fungal-type domain-containing protein n=1 Tax=Penicillium paxilli TaxID=70109 RepID=E3UBK8_PENPX|nr:hypothetical protein PP104 [Penicillium paxilli]
MAGPTRSKGCQGCLKRRIKCDEVHPECNNCRKRGQKCPGYERERKFVFFEATGPTQRSSTDVTPRKPKLRSSSESTKIVVQRQRAKGNPAHWHVPCDTRVSPSLVTGAWELQYRESFCAMLEGDCAPILHAYSQRTDSSWIHYLRSPHEDQQNALGWALRCVGSFRLGRMHEERQQSIVSREIYVRAVRELAHSLNNPSLILDDRTLAASCVLGTYEIINDDGQASWVTHAGGVGALIRLRGPRAHMSGFARTLFLSFRPWLVFGALLLGERCFLEEDQWAEVVPEVIELEAKSGRVSPLANLVEYAYQDIVRCPGYLVQTRKIKYASHSDESERKGLIERIISSQQRLEEFQNEISACVEFNQPSPYHYHPEFIGAMTVEAGNLMGEYTLKGINSAIALLQRLLVVLQNDGQRDAHADLDQTWATPAGTQLLTPESTTEKDHPLPDPLTDRGRASREDLLVRVALSMGMTAGTLPI